jgi:hypothetical protein
MGAMIPFRRKVEMIERGIAFSSFVRLGMAAIEIWKVSARSVIYGH